MKLMERSILTGILIICILIIRQTASTKLPGKVYTILWKIALLRLLLPFYFPVGRILGNMFPAFRREWSTLGINTGQALLEAGNGKMEKAFVPDINFILTGGMIVTAVFFIVGYIKCHARLSESIPYIGLEQEEREVLHDIKCGISGRTVEIHILDTIATPITCGIVAPRIILPKAMDFSDKETMHYVLRHEMIHIRLMDNLWKLLCITALCMHWFNPLVWVLYLLYSRDMEIDCDQRVIGPLLEAERQKYALTLVKMMEKNVLLQMLYSGFGRSAVSERIAAIMNYKKITVAGTICAILLLAGGATVFVSAKGMEEDQVVEDFQTANGCLSIYFDEGITDQQRENIGAMVERREEVTSLEYISAEYAWEKFSEEYLDEETVTTFTTNPLKDSSSYTVYYSGKEEELIQYAESLDGVRVVHLMPDSR